MAYRELGMWEILDVLRRVHRGETRAAIRRATGRSRTTVRRYLREAGKLGWEPTGTEPDEALAMAVARWLRPGPDAESLGSVEAQLAPHQVQLRAWLRPADGSRGLRLTKVHDLLARQGVGVPYRSLPRYVVAPCGFQDV